MSAISVVSPTAPLQRRDIRSDNVPFKRDRDQSTKWCNGIRPMSVNELLGGSERRNERIRPNKLCSQISTGFDKAHNNFTIKPNPGRGFHHHGQRIGVCQKAEAIFESREQSTSPLSQSFLELVPGHVNNEDVAVNTAADYELFYSFDRKEGPGEAMALGDLVDRAQKRWESEKTDRIVKGEYEVLDCEGERVRIGRGRKGSPRQKAKVVEEMVNVDDDDGFELI